MMDFKPDKCESISITNQVKPIKSNYTMHGKTLKKVNSTKYLGVTIDNKLAWNQHVDNICKTTNSTRAFLQRTTNKCPRHIKSRCYTTYVRPLLESLNWQTLQCRRQQAKAAMMYRIVNGLVAIPTDDLTPIQNRTRCHGTRFL